MVTMRAGGGLGIGSDWRAALTAALAGALAPLQGEPPDLLFLFASAAYERDYAELLQAAMQVSQTTELAGCSASAVIGGTRELETEPGVAALALTLPRGALLNVRYLASEDVRSVGLAGISSAECHGRII